VHAPAILIERVDRWNVVDYGCSRTGRSSGLREKGVLNGRKNTRGDEIVKVVLRSPDVHDERTRELLRELAQVQRAMCGRISGTWFKSAECKVDELK
jgi:DnaJ-class molecular chaperone